MSVNNYFASESDASETNENTYCIFLHIVEGIGFNLKDSTGGGDIADQRKNVIFLKASLNGVQFEVEGHSITHETATVFNSNCIWECELDDIKRMKTDNRPVKLECFLKSGSANCSSSKSIGSLLLPIRGVKIINNLPNPQLKIYWHKLGTLSSEWRQNRPEIYLMLLILKKNIIESGQLDYFLGKRKSPTTTASNSEIMLSPNMSETASMLQSQSNVYVQLLEQVGQIQVGNNPDIDCDIFCVTLLLKQIKNVMGLLKLSQTDQQCQKQNFIFQYDFLGSKTNLEITVNINDCYTVNEKLSLNFRSSLKSLRLYFQRIFYIPINLYYNDIAIANYQFDLTKLLPDNMHFENISRLWTKNGTFTFDRLHKTLSPKDLKPSIDFIFTIKLQTPYPKRNNLKIVSLNETFIPYERKEYDNMNQIVQAFNKRTFEKNLTSRDLEMHEKLYAKEVVKQFSYSARNAIVSFASTMNECSKDDHVTEKNEIKCLGNSIDKQTNTVCLGTEDEPLKTFKSTATNTEPCEITDHEELTLKIVQELEDWKSQQMEHFINELKRREATYLKDLQTNWEQHRVIWQARLDAKMAKCEQLNAQLEKAQIELNTTAIKNRETINFAETIRRDIESNYAKKFFELESEMQRLKLDMQQRGKAFEIKNKQVEIDNTCLEREKAELKERVEQLEKQIIALQDSHLSADQIKDIRNDLRKQRERIVAMEKSRNFYKDQWSQATQEINNLKIKVLKLREEAFERKTSKNIGIDFNLQEILNEEQVILKSDRSELKSIKLSLFSSSDFSSGDELKSHQETFLKH